MIYLASPYSDPDPFVRERRYLAVLQALRHLISTRPITAVYCPIVHWHDASKIIGLPKDAHFWQAQNFEMLRFASALVVVRMDGWDRSVGVADEIAYAEELKIPVEYL